MNRFSPLSLLLASLLTSSVQALPDDRDQEVVVNADSSEIFMNEGRVVYYGTADNHATITQGSMVVSGEEITIEREEGNPRKITATGSPARFQQQPALDKEIIHGSANTITYDHATQHLVMEEAAELIQENNRINGYFVEYDMQSSRARAASRDDERINMTIQPDAAQ